MPNRVSNFEETTLTNVDIGVSFIRNPSFHKWSHSLVTWVFVWAIAQHKGMVYLFPHMHTHKTENKKNN